MRIGEAKAAGVSIQTLRFYERRGLLAKPATVPRVDPRHHLQVRVSESIRNRLQVRAWRAILPSEADDSVRVPAVVSVAR